MKSGYGQNNPSFYAKQANYYFYFFKKLGTFNLELSLVLLVLVIVL